MQREMVSGQFRAAQLFPGGAIDFANDISRTGNIAQLCGKMPHTRSVYLVGDMVGGRVLSKILEFCNRVKAGGCKMGSSLRGDCAQRCPQSKHRMPLLWWLDHGQESRPEDRMFTTSETLAVSQRIPEDLGINRHARFRTASACAVAF